MKRLLSVLLALCCALMGMITPAYAAKKQIPDFCMEILERWGATNEKELQQAILTYWETNQPNGWKSMHKTSKAPVSFQFGGTTKEVIANHKKWDVAIVSSKDVDLQKLADAGVIEYNPYASVPTEKPALRQWTYPEAVQQMLPQHPCYYYEAYLYSYDAATNEAIFLVANTKGRPGRWYSHWITQLLEGRSVEQARAAEGFCQNVLWEHYDRTEMSLTEEDLVANPTEWDLAFLRIAPEDKLEKLDAAGLLYDFSQDEYWAGRNPVQEELDTLEIMASKDEYWVGREPSWNVPASICSADGRMIAIPYADHTYIYGNNIYVFVVNAKSPVLSNALAYAKHFIKTKEWYEYGKWLKHSDFAEIKKYNEIYKKRADDGKIFGILKSDIDW